MPVFPLVPFAEDGERRDAVVPTPPEIVRKPKLAQIGHIVIDQRAGAPEILTAEEAQARPAKDANGADTVVEPAGERGPALMGPQAEV